MPTAILRPNGGYADTDATFWGKVGAASASAALSDNSDASYVQRDEGYKFPQDFGTVALPVGAVTKQIRVRARARAVTTTGTTLVMLRLAGVEISGASIESLVTTAFAEVVGAYVPVSWTQADVDAVQAGAGLGQGDSIRYAELYIDLVYALVPSVAVSGPTGNITTTNTPTVTWVHTAGTDGGPQSRYRVRVFSAAQYGAAGFNPATSAATFDSSEQINAAFSAVVGPLPNTTTYRAYVATSQTINGVPQWGDYAYTAFSIAATTSDITSVTATGDSVKGRNRITVVRNAATPYWVTLELQRSTDGGTTWASVRGVVQQTMPGDVWIGYDYETGNGQATIYRARATYGVPGLLVTGAWVQSTSVSWLTAGVDWLKDLRSPANSLQVILGQGSLAALNRARPRGVFGIVGRPDPVVISDIQHLATGEFTVITLEDDEALALEALLQADVLLLQTRPGERFGSRYLAIGDVTELRPGNAEEPSRVWLLPFTEVAAPADYEVVIAGLTWADIVATYATWTLLLAGRPTWGDLV